MSYTSVSRRELQQAFAIAHRASVQSSTPAAERAKVRAIARLIWNAHGEAGTPPVRVDDMAAALGVDTDQGIEQASTAAQIRSMQTRPDTAPAIDEVEG